MPIINNPHRGIAGACTCRSDMQRGSDTQRRTHSFFMKYASVFGRALMAGLAVVELGVSLEAAAETATVESVPLAARSVSTGQGTRFVRQEAAATGLNFQNTLKPENIRNYLINGAGVSVGDFDSDGWPDVFLVGQDGPNRLFRQVAPWKFEDVTERSGLIDTGAWGCGAALVDFTGDGRLDIFVCNKGAASEAWSQQADGTFTLGYVPLWPAEVAGGTMAAFADYDRDGDLDFMAISHRLQAARDQVNLQIEAIKDTRTGRLVVAPPYDEHFEYLDDAGQVLVERGVEPRLLRNDGRRPDGSPNFSVVTAAARLPTDRVMALAAHWFDANLDGWPDLWLSNDFNQPDRLCLNQRDGTFKEVAASLLPYHSWFSMGSDAADLNRDGWIDILSTDMAGSSHFKSKTTMGAMSASSWFLDHLEPRQAMRNCLYINQGTSSSGDLLPFLETAHASGLASTDWTWSALFGDLDNDGWEDVHFTTGLERNVQDSDYAERARARAMREKVTVAEAQQEIVALPRMAEINWAFRNLGAAAASPGLGFEKSNTAWGLDFPSVSFGQVMSDLDRDGDLDLVVNTQNEPPLVLRNDTPAAQHAALISLRSPLGANRFALGARLVAEVGGARLTRTLTSSRGYASGQEPTVHFGLGSAERIDRLTVIWPSGRRSEIGPLAQGYHHIITEPAAVGKAPAVADAAGVTAAAAPLVFKQAPTPPFRHAEDRFDDFSLQELLPNRLSHGGPAAAVADVDGDGLEDVFLGGAKGQPGSILRRMPGDDVVFKPLINRALEADLEPEDAGAAWFDADADGDVDLLVAGGGVQWPEGDVRYQPRMYLNDGTGQLTRAAAGALPEWPHPCGPVAVGDIDRDGRMEIFLGGRSVPGRYPESAPSVVWRGRPGAYTPVPLPGPPLGLVNGAVWADLNNDGWTDLTVAQEWGPLRVFMNQGAGAAAGAFRDATTEAGLAALSGWWNGVVAADMDADGDLDLVATNWGLNTKYQHISADHPQQLFAADFAGLGRVEPVEAKTEGGQLVPVRGRSCSSHAIPFLREKFTSYRAFASASLEEIYGAERLQSATRLEVTTLASMMLRNDGSAVFTAEPLPWEAQLSPAFGVVAEDFDQDGWMDLWIAQGHAVAQRETGRQTGGLPVLLRGQGGGRLAAVSPARSGLSWRGDVRAAVLLDGHTLLMTVNDAAARVAVAPALQAAGVRRLGLRPRGGGANAAGTRVTATLADGRPWMREVNGGGGYGSQSSSTLAIPAGVSEVTVRWPDGTSSRHPVPTSGLLRQP